MSCVLAVFFTAQAYSADGPYLSANLGLAALSDSDITNPGEESEELSYDTGWTLGAAVGYRFNNVRVEGELSYQKNDADQLSQMGDISDMKGDATSTALLVNGYYDFANESAFTPYISAGLGYAKVETNDMNVVGSSGSDFNEDDGVFAYQVGAGVGYAVNENVTLDLKYRYFATEDAELDTSEVEFASHNFLVGIRYNF